MVNEILTGTIKAIVQNRTDPTKDFGFIQLDGELPSYNSGIHFNILRNENCRKVWNNSCYVGPRVGDRVSFSVVTDKSGRQTCVNVTKLGVAQPRPTTAKEDPTYAKAAQAVLPVSMEAISVGIQEMSDGDEGDLLEEIESFAEEEEYDEYESYYNAQQRKNNKKGGREDD